MSSEPMKKKLNLEFLKMYRKHALKHSSSHLKEIHQQTCTKLDSHLQDILRPFSNVCIQSVYPNLIIPMIQHHNLRVKAQGKSPQSINPRFTIVDSLDQSFEGLGENVTIERVAKNDDWIHPEQNFDLIVSSLELQNTNSVENLLRKFSDSLKPDGAVIGTTFGEQTLQELEWAYLMAENQRSGGISPKVGDLYHPGQLGHELTVAHFNLITIVPTIYTLYFDSVIDLLDYNKLLGYSGYLKGRRKGIYKDVLLAMSALYHSEFEVQEDNEFKGKIPATVEIVEFIGWKYSESQPKPLRRGTKAVDENESFVDELKKFDEELEHYVINPGNDQPQRKL